MGSCHVIVWHSANLATSRSHCLQLCCYETHATQVTGILIIIYLSPSLRPCWGLTWGLCGQPIMLKDLTVHRFTARISGSHRSNALMAHTDRRLPSLLPFPILSKKCSQTPLFETDWRVLLLLFHNVRNISSVLVVCVCVGISIVEWCFLSNPFTSVTKLHHVASDIFLYRKHQFKRCTFKGLHREQIKESKDGKFTGNSSNICGHCSGKQRDGSSKKGNPQQWGEKEKWASPKGCRWWRWW